MNEVELLGIYGSDQTHALSAWTSTSRSLTQEKIKRIPNLLKMLADGSDGNSHGTPFEKSTLHFLVKTDIATHIHLLKHRIGTSINAESARYKELKSDSFLIPKDWPKAWKNKLQKHTEEGLKLYHESLNDLVNIHKIDRKRAKESSRFFLPYNIQITADISFNFRSFVYFLKLRNTPGAQKEVRELAKQMLNIVKKDGRFKHSLKAFKL